MAVTIKFLGGVRTVTGSSHLITTAHSQVLLDAGLFHGRRDEFYQLNTALEYNPHKINAVVLSHAHIDHCGNLPQVARRGLHCKIYATSATKDLARLMLADSGRIQEEDVRYLNKVNRRLGLPPRRPLYTQKDAGVAVKRFRAISYGQRFCLTKDVFVTLLDAGHILGSSIIVLEIKDIQRTIKVGYAVDLGRKNLPLLNNPVIPKGLDYLILESTYGNRQHSPIEQAKVKLKEVINRTVERKGKIIIPSFALERTQEVLFFLNELLKDKAIPVLPIYVDSPLATEVTDVFKKHQDYFDPETQKDIRLGKNPFDFLNLRFVRSQEESKALNNNRRPMIILAGSGMCESGRVLHHLKNNIEDSRNTVLVVGYMARDTLGRKIVEHLPVVRIFGIGYQLNAEVAVINSFSGHADRGELLDFVDQCQPLRRIFLVHGDVEQSEALQAALVGAGGEVSIPGKNEEALLE